MASTIPRPIVEYRGKLTRNGNSKGFRLESAFFRSHPEFAGNVTARVVGPGQVLLTADQPEHHDPVLDAYLDLLARDMDKHPERVMPMQEASKKESERLTAGMPFRPDEDLGNEDLLA